MRRASVSGAARTAAVTSASRFRPSRPAHRPRTARRPRTGGRPIRRTSRLVSPRRRRIHRSRRMWPRPPTGLGPVRVHPDDGGATRRFGSVPARQAMWCCSPPRGSASRTPLGPRHRCRGPRGAPFARCEGACAGKADIGAQPTDCAARRCCGSAHAASVARAANDVVHPVRTSPGAAALRGGLVWAARARSRASSTSLDPAATGWIRSRAGTSAPRIAAGSAPSLQAGGLSPVARRDEGLGHPAHTRVPRRNPTTVGYREPFARRTLCTCLRAPFPFPVAFASSW